MINGRKYIIITGNMATGKTTLAELISKEFGWKVFYEPYIENPYLSSSYADKEQWGFKSQIFFLSNHLKQHLDSAKIDKSVVKDCSIYESVEIYARNMYNLGELNEQDWHTYYKLYGTLTSVLPNPDLIIYLHADIKTILNRIGIRARDFEMGITELDISNLNKLYEEWIESVKFCRVMTIDTDLLDFVNNSNDMRSVVSEIKDILLI